MNQLTWRSILALAASLVLLGGCATTGSERLADNDKVFPKPPALHDNVTFWRNVYADWSRAEVAIHDAEHLAIVYEVVKLPGPIGQGYSSDQRRLVRARKAHHQQRLDRLERKIDAARSLTRNERALRDQLIAAGGRQAIGGASKRVRIQRGLRERFRRGLEISGRYEPRFREIMRRHGLPEDLAFLPHVESSYQVNARSAVGAAGVWQFMPATGRLYMRVTRAIDERLDPVLAADAAARYLGNAYHRLGSWPLAITSYNHGVGGMERARAVYGDDIGAIVEQYDGKAFGFSSRNFYACFLAAREVASQPERYFPEGISPYEPMSDERLVLDDSLSATAVARHYGLPIERLGMLNLAWRQPIHSGRASLPAGSTVWLPKGTMAQVPSQPRAILLADATPVKPSQAQVGKERRTSPANEKPVAAIASKPAVVVATRPKARHHVVKPNETLYRVAVQYELSVDELRQLNRIPPDDNVIRPGQRLRVSS